MTPVPDGTSRRAVRKVRVKALVFLVLSLAAGAGAVYLVKAYLDGVRSGVAAPAKMVPVVVAASSIPVGSVLTEQALAVVKWPEASAPDGTFKAPEEVLGRTALQAIVKGEPILTARLADQAAGRGLGALLKPGMRAMAVKVDQVVGVAGFVQPGDRVDVIATMTPDTDTRHALDRNIARVSKIILQNVGVLAIGEHLSSQGTKPVSVQVVTLEVAPDQSERLALASRYGDIHLLIRSPLDIDPVQTTGITPSVLLVPDVDLVAALREEKPVPQVPAPRRVAKERPAAPAAPVVEILRGTRVEQRKLLPSADSRGGQ